MTSYAFTFPPSSLTPHAKGRHWAPKAKATRAYRRLCAGEAWEQGLRRIHASEIAATITIHRPDLRRDYANCIGAFKAGIDGIADVIGIDDRYWRQTWVEGELCPPSGRIVIEFSLPDTTAQATGELA